MNYKQYIKSPEWRETRRKFYASNQYNGACANCEASDKMLRVHHKRYDNLGHEPLEDLVALCDACHRELHGLPEKSELTKLEKFIERVKKQNQLGRMSKQPNWDTIGNKI